MKTKFATSRSIRFLFLPLLMLFIALQLSAQPPRGVPGGRGPADHHRFDSIQRPPHDSTIVHRHDTIPPFAHRDSIRPHRIDSNFVRHRHDTIPPIHPPHPDSTNTGPGHPRHTPPPHRPCPFPHDSTGVGHRDSTHHNGPDSTNHPPRPPFPPRDSTIHHGPNTPDTSNHSPHPPFPPRDTTEHGGGNDPDSTNGRHHKIEYITTTSGDASVLIYPNPVVSTSTIRIENAKNEVTFRLFETTGRMVMIQTGMGNGNYELNKANLSPGVYLYEMVDGNTSTKTGSIIIQ